MRHAVHSLNDALTFVVADLTRSELGIVGIHKSGDPLPRTKLDGGPVRHFNRGIRGQEEPAVGGARNEVCMKRTKNSWLTLRCLSRP